MTDYNCKGRIEGRASRCVGNQTLFFCHASLVLYAVGSQRTSGTWSLKRSTDLAETHDRLTTLSGLVVRTRSRILFFLVGNTLT